MDAISFLMQALQNSKGLNDSFVTLPLRLCVNSLFRSCTKLQATKSATESHGFPFKP